MNCVGLGSCSVRLLPVFRFFLIMRVKTWCVGKFPGHPGPQITHAYTIPFPSYLILSLAYIPAPMSIIPTHLHPSEPINMLINNIYFQYHKFRLFIFSCFWVQNSIYMYLISQIDHYSREQRVSWPFQHTIARYLTPSTSWALTWKPHVTLKVIHTGTGTVGLLLL